METIAQITIDQVDQLLTIAGRRGELLRTLRQQRPSLSWDTLNRALRSNDENTPILAWIRTEARKMVDTESDLAKNVLTAQT